MALNLHYLPLYSLYFLYSTPVKIDFLSVRIPSKMDKIEDHVIMNNTYSANVAKCLIAKLANVVPEGYVLTIPNTPEDIYILFTKIDIATSKQKIMLVDQLFDTKQFYSNVDFHAIGGPFLLDYIARNVDAFLAQKVCINISTIDRLKIEVVSNIF